MKKVTNTAEESRNNPAQFLLAAMAAQAAGRRPGSEIEDMEARGQRELVESDVFPIDTAGTPLSRYEELGFKFHGPVEGDDIFQYVTLPEGWVRRASDHDMWSYIDDADGVERVRIFYKAAFYDRRAHASLIENER